MTETNELTVVLGGTGKTGRRVVERLTERGVPVRVGSRAGDPPFDWDRPESWPAVLRGAAAAYVSYFPDIAAEGAPERVRALAEAAAAEGVGRLVLLSGRGEAEALRAEQLARDVVPGCTVVRASWFAQNFDEGYLVGPVLAGDVALPVGDVPEPFVDAGDIADVAVAALTEDGHAGELYEVTGPRALSFADAVGEIGKAAGRDIAFHTVPLDAYTAELTCHGVPADVVAVLSYVFGEVLDGRNSGTTDGIRRALGRQPKDFADYARDAAATGVWSTSR